VTPLHVACAADARYVPHAAAMLHSIAAGHGDTEIRVHFLHGPELEPHLIRALQSMFDGTPVSIAAHQVEPAAVAGLPAWGRIPATMWYRILLPDLLPDVTRILYLDVDVIVVDPISDLWQLDLDGFYLAAVTNVPERHMLGHARDLGLPGADRYFNSGVLLMNLDLMRRDDCAAALSECALGRLDDLLWPDQDALNLVLGDRRLDLHPRWNMMNSIRAFPWSEELLDPVAVREAIENPAIVHFEGPRENKPWHLLCDHPFRGAYREHRLQTPWPRFRPDGLTAPNLLRLVRRRVAASRAG
jgi:lipopolysaccharide biosynthesis glycosyltransferase